MKKYSSTKAIFLPCITLNLWQTLHLKCKYCVNETIYCNIPHIPTICLPIMSHRNGHPATKMYLWSAQIFYVLFLCTLIWTSGMLHMGCLVRSPSIPGCTAMSLPTPSWKGIVCDSCWTLLPLGASVGDVMSWWPSSLSPLSLQVFIFKELLVPIPSENQTKHTLKMTSFYLPQKFFPDTLR